MLTNEHIVARVKGKAAAVRFEDFLPTPECPEPSRRINDFIVLGPFVLETGGALETEYLYERHKVLDCDYLSDDGGEADMVPFLGLKCRNRYFGPEELEWTKGMQKWDCLRFDTGDYNACDRALYATEQRNCVYYAAVYVDCRQEQDAVLCYETSGSLVYLNGVLVDNRPYGRVKGLIDYGNQVALRFHAGRNLLMFKIRTGYICDTIDLSMSNCALYPVITKSGSLGITYPMRTGAFVGTAQTPAQVFPAFAGAFGDVPNGQITVRSGDYEQTHIVGELAAGECACVRLSLPSADTERLTAADIEVCQTGAPCSTGHFALTTKVFDGFCGTEHIFSDFHFDTTYHQEQRVYALGAIHILKNMLEKLEKNPRFKAILSEVDYLHPYYSIFPEDRAFMRQMFLLGRAEADCFYNQPNEMTSSPEGLVRNLVHGQLYHRDVLGAITPVYGPGDVFGHPNQLSQLCRKGGCIGVYWGKSILGLDCLFTHVSPDGTGLIHSRGHTSRADAMRLGVGHCHASSNADAKVTAYPREDDTAWMEDTLTHAQFSVMSDFHEGVIRDDETCRRETGSPLIALCSRDISLYHAGVALTRTDLKQANRLAENLLITAEKFAAVACLYGAEYPEKALDKAWRQLLCGQHHDSITGTNNEISFVDLMIEYREAAELAADIVNRATAFLASGVVPRAQGRPVAVFNPHTWDRREPCIVTLPAGKRAADFVMRDADGRDYPLQSTGGAVSGHTVALFLPRVPAMGYKMYYLTEKSGTDTVREGRDCVIENAFYRLRVDSALGGGLVSVYDKKAKREVLKNGPDGPANRVVILREIPDRMETQHEFYTTGHKMVSSDFLADIQSVKGENFTRLVSKVRMGTVAVVRQEITLYTGVKRIDFKTVVEDYRDDDDLFTVTFPLDIQGARPVFDDRFAPQVRCESDKKLEFQTHQYAMVSRCQVYAANQWLDYGPTVTLKIKNGTVNVGMTAIVRAETPSLHAAADTLLTALTKKAVPVTCYPDSTQAPASTRLIHFNEDVMNTDTRFVLSDGTAKNDYEEKLLATLKPARRAAFENALKNKGVATLFARDADNLIHKPIDVMLIKTATPQTMAEIIKSLADELAVSRFATLPATITADKPEVADDYGAAILNTGNLACSVERGGMLNLMLFHTAEFYGNIGNTTGGPELVPEQKTHVFTYALCPHQGSYREAEIYRRGLEFNDPLIAVSDFTPAANTPLPAQKSFLRSSHDFLVTAFKLTGYPMASLRGHHGDVYERGLTIRGFEPHGVTANTKLSFGFDARGACSVDLLDENPQPLPCGKNTLNITAPSHSIETFTVMPAENADRIGAAVLGAEKELVQPVYIRSWEHDLGTMPIGYLAMTGVIDRKVRVLDETTFCVDIHLVNNRPDTSAAGHAVLRVPEGWEADTQTVDYDLAPGDYISVPVRIKKPDADAQGLILLGYADDGQEFEDVFEVGCFKPEVSMEIYDERIVVTVTNLTAVTLSGELALATPVETWSVGGHNPFAFADIGPRTMKVAIGPGEQRDYAFAVTPMDFDMFPAYYAVAKLMVNGRLYFAYADRRGPRHNVWAHEFWGELAADGGSIRKLLKM